MHSHKQKKRTIFGTTEWDHEFVTCASLLYFTLLCQDLARALHFPLYYTFYNYGFENGIALINSLLPYLVGIYKNEVFSIYLRLLLFCCYSSNKIRKVHPNTLIKFLKQTSCCMNISYININIYFGIMINWLR